MGKKRNKVQVILPHGALGGSDDDDALDLTLRIIALGFHAGEDDGWSDPSKYGIDFENDVFEMHYDRQDPQCDCGAAKPVHKPDCDTLTKRQAWLDARNRVGMIEHTTEGRPEPEGGWSTPMAAFFAAPQTDLQSTETTFDEQNAWQEANPFPACSCGEEAAWIARNGHEPKPDGASFFDRGGDHWRDYQHTRECDLSIYQRPQFTYKPTGFVVRWYKYIGRDMEATGEMPRDLLKLVFASHPAKMTARRAAERYAKRRGDSKAAFEAMFAALNEGRS